MPVHNTYPEASSIPHWLGWLPGSLSPPGIGHIVVENEWHPGAVAATYSACLSSTCLPVVTQPDAMERVSLSPWPSGNPEVTPLPGRGYTKLLIQPSLVLKAAPVSDLELKRLWDSPVPMAALVQPIV